MNGRDRTTQAAPRRYIFHLHVPFAKFRQSLSHARVRAKTNRPRYAQSHTQHKACTQPRGGKYTPYAAPADTSPSGIMGTSDTTSLARPPPAVDLNRGCRGGFSIIPQVTRGCEPPSLEVVPRGGGVNNGSRAE